MYHERTKHVNIRYHFIREIISQGHIVVKKIGIDDNPIDMMTKLLSIVKFKHYLDLIGVRNIYSYPSGLCG